MSLIVVCILSISALGLSSHHHARIINGFKVGIKGHEYMAAVLAPKNPWSREMVFMCSAVIVDYGIALTTGSCMRRIDKATAVIRSNSSNWHSGHYSYDHYIINIFPHPSWQYNDLDAALFEVKPYFFASYEKPIDVMSDFPPNTANLETYGWGRTDMIGTPSVFEYSFDLMGTQINLIDPAECVAMLPPHLKIKYPKHLLCSYESNGGSCNGDEGGPIILNGKLAGILTYAGCGNDTSLYSSSVAIFHYTRKHMANAKKSLGSQQDGRILNGVKVSIVGHEYMATVVAPRKQKVWQRQALEMTLICSAVIIYYDLVLTTGSCIKRVDKATAVIRSNSSNWHSRHHGYIDHRIVNVFSHPHWKYADLDAAIVEVEPYFDGIYEQPIDLIDSFPPVDAYLESYGWGTVDMFGTDSSIFRYSLDLMGTGLKVMNPAECAAMLPEDVKVKYPSELLCSKEAEIGGCNGDEGSPFILDGKLAGILSYPGCGRAVSVYASTVSLFRWLKSRVPDSEKSRVFKMGRFLNVRRSQFLFMLSQ